MTMQTCLAAGALAVSLSLTLLGAAMAEQPKMHGALTHLQAARAALEQTTPDKSGHRKRALRQVNKAIDSVQNVIASDRAH